MALVLCDIDGTLVSGASSYGTTMEKAISRVYHAEVSVDLNKFHGYTDKLVMREILNRYGVSYDSSSLDECLRLFGELFPDNPEDISVIPGVLETIPKLWEDYQLGLVTGNVELMARKKLRLFKADGISLSDYFLFGGFGGTDSHESRADLIHLAIERAINNGWTGKNKHTFLIDDSQRGLAAAIDARVVPIGITTGKYTEEQLRQTGVEHIADNFREIPDLIERLCDANL